VTSSEGIELVEKGSASDDTLGSPAAEVMADRAPSEAKGEKEAEETKAAEGGVVPAVVDVAVVDEPMAAAAAAGGASKDKDASPAKGKKAIKPAPRGSKGSSSSKLDAETTGGAPAGVLSDSDSDDWDGGDDFSDSEEGAVSQDVVVGGAPSGTVDDSATDAALASVTASRAAEAAAIVAASNKAAAAAHAARQAVLDDAQAEAAKNMEGVDLDSLRHSAVQAQKVTHADVLIRPVDFCVCNQEPV
jgi:hypothetical protein